MNRHMKRAAAKAHGKREAMPNTGLHYMQRMKAGKITEVELQEIRKGDVFRAIEPGLISDWQVATTDAERVESVEYPGRYLWQVAQRRATDKDLQAARIVVSVPLAGTTKEQGA